MGTAAQPRRPAHRDQHGWLAVGAGEVGSQDRGSPRWRRSQSWASATLNVAEADSLCFRCLPVLSEVAASRNAHAINR